MLSLEMICRAQHRLRGLVHRTPLVHSAALSDYLGAKVYLKLELLQKTGSFKPRGASTRCCRSRRRKRAGGVVAVSGGNHAQGVAFAARQLGISAVIAMPAATPRNYLDATRGYGADIVLTPDIRAAFAEAAPPARSRAASSSIPSTTRSWPRGRAPSAWRSWKTCRASRAST